MPRFSIVVPTWQRARFLPRCLASVAAQPGAWECIVVDDGSTDDTPAIVRAHAAGDRRFRLLTEPHRGAAAARNAGLEVATGEWIAFLDSDDEYLPGALAVLARAAAAVPDARVVCGGLTGTMRVDGRAAMDGRIVTRDAFLEMLGFSIEGPRVQLIAAAFHRSVFDAGVRFAPDYHSSEDRELLVRVTARHPVTIVRTFVARYHEGHGDGASDRSLVDGSKLVALRRMLAELGEHPEVRARLTPAILRLRDAHLDVLDAAAAVRDGGLDRAAGHLTTAAARCDDVELEALLVRFVYLLTSPVTRPREAAARSAAWLEALARRTPDRRLAAGLTDAAVGIRLWAAVVLARSGSPGAAVMLAAATIRDAGARRTISTVLRLFTARSRRASSCRSGASTRRWCRRRSPRTRGSRRGNG